MAGLFYLQECKSTNDEISSFLHSGTSECTAVYTFHQTQGKGQYGNSWECAPNLNLAFTVAVPSAGFVGGSTFVNFRTAALLADFLAKLTNTKIEIKWPNDLIIKNKKVGGILSEQKNVGGEGFFLIGIGLNLLQENFENLPKGGSILTQIGVRLDPEETAQSLYIVLSEVMKSFSIPELMEKINNNLFRKDVVSVFELNGIRQNGIIRNVDADGLLWVELESGGLRKFFHKEIELLY